MLSFGEKLDDALADSSIRTGNDDELSRHSLMHFDKVMSV
jgi:hypothetical protein